MAKSLKTVTSKISDIQSKAQETIQSNQKKVVSSTKATQEWSTTTPTVTDTPKVASTAKAMPSITRPDISSIVPTKTTTPTTTTTPTASTADVKNLLWSKTTPTIRKSATPDLLSKTEEKKEIKDTTIPLNIVSTALNLWWKVAQTVTNSLYEQWLDWINDKFTKLEQTREKVTDVVWKTAIDMFKWVGSDISTQFEEWKWLWMTYNAVMNTLQWIPRWIARIEYWASELLDWVADTDWSESIKQSFKSDLEYWENTKTYQKIKETEWFSDFLKNPLMYAWGTLWEMLPMFINAWVAIPTTFAQIYWETYGDYSQDASLQEAWLSDNQVRLMSLWVAWVNTIIELWSDLIQWLMPWTKTAAKWAEKEIRRSLSKPFYNFFRKISKWWVSEWLEEVLQNEMQSQVAIAWGSDRPAPTWQERLTIWWISSMIWAMFWWWDFMINFSQSNELNAAFNEWSEAVDKIAPWVSKKDKKTLFSAIVAAQVEDMQMSEDKVNKYEAETTELYNKIDELTNQLETTTDKNQKEQIQNQIDLANKRISTIDEMINKSNKVEKEVTAKLKELSEQRLQEQEAITQEEELPAMKQETQMPSEIWGKNLSEQTMKDSAVIESKPVDKMNDIEVIKANKYWWDINTKTPQEKQKQKDIKYEYNRRLSEASDNLTTEDMDNILAMNFDDSMYFKVEAALKELSNLIYNEQDLNKRTNLIDVYNKIMNKQKQSRESVQETETEKRDTESLLPDTQIDSNLFYENWKKRTWWSIDEYSMSIWNQDREHIPWLMWVKIAWVENLSEAEILEAAKSAAEVAGILWIDFNKLLENARLSVLNLKWETVRWTEWIWWRLNTWGIDLSKWILRMSMILKDTWPAIFWHELMHLLDKEYLFRNDKILTKSGRSISWESMINLLWLNKKFNTYKNRWNDYWYWDSWRETLARYAEQYIAKRVDKGYYKELIWKSRYWSDAEFKKLESIFENMIKTQFSEFLLDEWDRNIYPKIMRKMVELQYNEVQFWLWEQTEMVFKLAEMKTQYDEIVADIENIKNETIKIELENEASNLYSNFEMLNKMKDEYIQIQKTTPKQQETIDRVTNTIMPEPPQNPDIIRYGLPYYWWSNIENGIWKMFEWKSWNEDFMKSYMTEQERIKMNKRLGKFKTYGKELWNAWNDLVTPAFTRIYNRAPRVAWRLLQMEADTIVYIHRYRMKAKWFVESIWKLKWKQALEVKKALLDYWALASEQWENIEEYKKQEVAKLKEVLLNNWIKEKDINDMFEVLNDIWRQYQEAWLSITLSDMYFPRVVKDYEWLIDYMNRVSGKNIQENKKSLLRKIKDIQSDTEMTQAEKEAKIRNAISIEFKRPSTESKHGKERKIWLLSDWWAWIYAYYENPIQSIDNYIVTMTNAIQRQLFLWWIRNDANINESEIADKSTSESVSAILWKMVDDWIIDENDLDIVQRNLLAVLNKKPSPKIIRAISDITYIATITNFISAINQLDDLWVAIIQDKNWFKEVVKTIFNQAWIKYDDLWLDDAYEMFREWLWVSNWLFKKSWFNAIDRLGKVSFVNAAWESLKHQAKNKNTRWYLYTRLETMYWRECADRMMEKIDKWNFNWKDWQIDIEILRDLLYQLWNTQPIFTSSMPVTYLNNPRVRPCYSLSSFTLKRIDMLIQWSRRIAWRDWFVKAASWLMWVSFYLALFWAAIWDVWDLLKKKKDETFLWVLLNEWINEALISWWKDVLQSWLKIWDLSEYDLKIFRQQWLKWVLLWKVTPFIYDLWLDVQQAIAKHDKDEITDLAKYVPIFWKMIYYWFWDELGKSVWLDSNWFVRRKEESFTKRDESWYTRRDDKWFIRRS